MIVPLWEFPDEQAHFAQVSYYSETGTNFKGNDLSYEIYESERTLGTLRNERGENEFTYKPQNKHNFSSDFNGPEEEYLKSLPLSSRTQYVKREAALYPPLFYLVSSVGYRLFYPDNLFIRVFFTRLASVFITLASVYFTFLTGKLILPKSKIFPTALAALVSFHPMFSFVSSGINNDNGINFIGIVILWLSLKILTQGLSAKLSLLMGLSLGLGVLIKPLIFPILPSVAVLFLYEWFKSKRSLAKEIKLLIPLIIAATLAGGWFFLKPIIINKDTPYLPKVNQSSPGYSLSLIDYSKSQLSKYYRETLVWYWGVFKWLGVVFPLSQLRVIKIVMTLSFFGLARNLISKKFPFSKEIIVTLIIYSLLYLITLTLWDYQLVRSIGFSHGIQGRNFFPTISAQMALLLIGLVSLSPKHFINFSKAVVISMIALNFSSLITIVSSYYSLTDLNTLVSQLSQYKPWFLKYPYSVFWFGAYVIVLSKFISGLLNLNAKNK